ncbi:PREDICTED: E3 ubiquitin-protein ligase TRIM38-like isoform X2 [Condylura cristata]|uniref:E3 ubiquitin-protein ligase TRIM38-like isoform X2 n=1 Tax=Condylura cristata TaxID=143302 RepID=UPI000643D46C|nr:PREDICTED: E3 ubiquitin-protein ligase TRIM38-like isoform X2 [Condylura cristata]
MISLILNWRDSESRTAHNDLLLSEDGRKVTHGGNQKKRHNSRFLALPSMGRAPHSSAPLPSRTYRHSHQLQPCVQELPPILQAHLSRSYTRDRRFQDPRRHRDPGSVYFHHWRKFCLRQLQYWSFSGSAMATAPATKKMMEEAACSICLQIMPEPVSISCGHSLCHRCITGKFENQPQGTSQLRRSHCPLCQAPFEKGDIRPNQQLENFTESIRELEHERLCEEHGKQLHLFCEDDGQLICWRCERSPRHRGHSTALVEYAGPRYRKILQKVLTELEEEEKHCLFMKLITKDQIRQWEDKIARERRKIQCEFEKLYNFLHEEEQWFLWRLEEKKEQTLRKMQENEASLEKQRQEYKSRILELEEKCEQSAQDMLQNMRDTLGRCMAMNTEVPEAVSLELQTVCNVSELYLDMKKILKSYQGISPTLQLGLAHSNIVHTIICDNLTAVLYLSV